MKSAFWVGVMFIVGKWIGVLFETSRLEYVAHLTFDFFFLSGVVALMIKVSPKYVPFYENKNTD